MVQHTLSKLNVKRVTFTSYNVHLFEHEALLCKKINQKMFADVKKNFFIFFFH